MLTPEGAGDHDDYSINIDLGDNPPAGGPPELPEIVLASAGAEEAVWQLPPGLAQNPFLQLLDSYDGLICTAGFRRILQPPGEDDQRSRLPYGAVIVAGAATAAMAVPTHAFAQSEETDPHEIIYEQPPEIVIIGDSLTDGRNSVGLEADYAERGVVVTGLDYAVGRPLVSDDCDTPQSDNDSCETMSDGIRSLDAMQSQLATATAVGLYLGTNTPVERLAADAERVVRHAHELAPNAAIIMLEIMGRDEAVSNPILHSLENRLVAENINFHVVSYADSGVDLAPDNIHPTNYNQLLQVDLAQVIPLVLAQHERNAQGQQTPSTEAGANENPSTLSRIIDPVINLFGGDTDEPEPSYSIDIGQLTKPSEVTTAEYTAPAPALATAAESNAASPAPAPERTNRSLIPEIPFFQSEPEPAAAIDIGTLSSTGVIPAEQVEPAAALATAVLSTPEVIAATEIVTAELETKPVVEGRGIFYENGEPRQYLGNHTTNGGIIVSYGYGDIRNRGNGQYAQGNADSRSVENPEDDTGYPMELIAPVAGIVHLTNNSGEGNKVIIEVFRYDDGTALIWFGTHLSEFAVEDGQIVMPDDILGMSGSTGDASGVHHSTGIGIVQYGDWDNYLNSSEALNPFDYMKFVDISCLPTATDDPNEYCGPTTEGVYKSLPVHPAVLQQLGGQTPVAPEEEKSAENEPDDAGIAIDIGNLSVDVAAVAEATGADSEEVSSGAPIVDLLPILPNIELSINFGQAPEETPEAVPETPEVQPNAYNAEAPLLDVFTPEVIQAILPGAPMENIMAYTPLIMNALEDFELADPLMACYAFSTINPETSAMEPIEEIGHGEGKDHGQIDPETGQAYFGRGFVQTTWRRNYERGKAILNIDFVNHPELALVPENAAALLALYLKDHEQEIRDALAQGDLKAARQIVNGEAAHGLDEFEASWQICENLVLTQN